MDEQRIWLLSGTGEGPPIAAQPVQADQQRRGGVSPRQVMKPQSVQLNEVRAFPVHDGLFSLLSGPARPVLVGVELRGLGAIEPCMDPSARGNNERHDNLVRVGRIV